MLMLAYNSSVTKILLMEEILLISMFIPLVTGFHTGSAGFLQ